MSNNFRRETALKVIEGLSAFEGINQCTTGRAGAASLAPETLDRATCAILQNAVVFWVKCLSK